MTFTGITPAEHLKPEILAPLEPNTKYQTPYLRMKYPIVELSDCISCGVCLEISPDVFRMNDAGFVEVMELVQYPETDVNDAIKYCPVDCIFWEES